MRVGVALLAPDACEQAYAAANEARESTIAILFAWESDTLA